MYQEGGIRWRVSKRQAEGAKFGNIDRPISSRLGRVVYTADRKESRDNIDLGLKTFV